MLKHLVFIALAATFAVGIGYTQFSASASAQASKTVPTSGKEMYVNYCASCHGMDAKGSGPAAVALKTPPPDLTVLTKNNHGKFPEAHIVTILQYGKAIPSHGSAEMPVWGPILGTMEKSHPQNKQLRISNLSQYLQSLQVK